MTLRAAFLDRDGTLIHDRGYLADPAGVELLPGAAEAVACLVALGYVPIVTTNQSGLARGMFDVAAIHAVNARLDALLATVDATARIAEYRFCPHGPDDGCVCRKPRPGMILAAAEARQLDLGSSVSFGDSARDVEAAEAAGCGFAAQIVANTGGLWQAVQQLREAKVAHA